MDFSEKYSPGLSCRLSESMRPVPWGVVIIINLVLDYSHRAPNTTTFLQKGKRVHFPIRLFESLQWKEKIWFLMIHTGQEYILDSQFLKGSSACSFFNSISAKSVRQLMVRPDNKKTKTLVELFKICRYLLM